MATVFPLARTRSHPDTMRNASSMARAMSRHAAAALLLFTGLQIWAIVALNHMRYGSVLPFIALAVLFLLAVPFSRRAVRRWQMLAHTALPCAGLIQRFRRDRGRLWRLAFIVPTVWVALFAAVAKAATII
ncbi:MAG: hypothetical protein ACKOUM_04845 [Sphingopyxis sp.]